MMKEEIIMRGFNSVGISEAVQNVEISMKKLRIHLKNSFLSMLNC